LPDRITKFLFFIDVERKRKFHHKKKITS
jgi:hypothetical protein